MELGSGTRAWFLFRLKEDILMLRKRLKKLERVGDTEMVEKLRATLLGMEAKKMQLERK